MTFPTFLNGHHELLINASTVEMKLDQNHPKRLDSIKAI